MDLSTQVVPAPIILVTNLLSGKRGSLQWETVTAIFGWTACISLVFSVALQAFSFEFITNDYLLQIS